MAAQAGVAYVDVKGRFDSLNAGVQSTLTGLTAKFGKFGVAAAAGIGVAFAAAGAAAVGLYKLGESFDAAYDTIRVGTGKTGKVLDGLKDDFKAVVSAVPTDFGTASTAIADLNTRLGLSGKPLQNLSKQFIELSRITKTDLAGNIQSVTRAFGDWEVPLDQQGAQLDKFFRAAQASGASVQDLASQVVQFGAPLRQVGFSLDTATAMFAAFERAGVNTQTMMPGLKRALASFLAEGREPGQALIDTFRGIKDGTISTSDALQIFGQRAGADMVEAIQQGRFELDELTASLVGGSDTIMQAAKDTNDLSEKFQILKNKVLVKLEPIASRVFDGLGVALDRLLPVLDRLMAKGEAFFASTTGTWQDIKDSVGSIVASIQVIWDRFGARISAFTSKYFGAVRTTIVSVFQSLKGIFDVFAGILSGDWSRVWDGIKNIFVGAWNAIKAIVDAAWEGLKTAHVIAGTFLLKIWDGLWSGMTAAAKAAWGAITGVFTGALDGIKSGVAAIPGFLVGVFTGALGAVKWALVSGWEGIRTWFSELPGKVVGAIGDVAKLLWDVGKKILQGLIDGAKSALGSVKDFFTGIGGKIIGWKGPLDYDQRLLIPAGKAIMGGLVAGGKAGLPAVESFFTGIAPRIEPIITKAGEGASTADQMAAIGTVAGGGVVENHWHLEGAVISSERDFMDMVGRANDRLARAGRR